MRKPAYEFLRRLGALFGAVALWMARGSPRPAAGLKHDLVGFGAVEGASLSGNRQSVLTVSLLVGSLLSTVLLAVDSRMAVVAAAAFLIFALLFRVQPSAVYSDRGLRVSEVGGVGYLVPWEDIVHYEVSATHFHIAFLVRWAASDARSSAGILLVVPR